MPNDFWMTWSKIMKQLISHELLVTLINYDGSVHKQEFYNVADRDVARQVGRMISEWLVGAEGRRVISDTLSVKHVHIGRQ